MRGSLDMARLTQVKRFNALALIEKLRTFEIWVDAIYGTVALIILIIAILIAPDLLGWSK